MKKVYLLLTLFLFSIFLSQEWTPIENVNNGIIAEGNRLLPIDGENDNPQSPGNSSSSLSIDSKYHDTKGGIEVTGSGELTFTFPIALPPGIKSVAPQINLVYGSNTFSGIAGIGWNISGLSSISRVGRNIEKDGEIKGVQFDYTDLYQFNGQRLILTSGEYGKPNATYTTQQFSNLKIKSIGTCSIPNTYGPEGFEVSFEDGSRAIFGMNSNAYNHHEYNITNWIDPFGNSIIYNYSKSNNTISIASIEWGKNQTRQSQNFNRINFFYKSRAVKQLAYANGIKSIRDNLLDYITVSANNSLFRTYTVTYTYPSNGIGYEIVSGIKESVSGDEARPITFQRNIADGNIISGSVANYIPETLDSYKSVKGDFDGDGKLDILNFVPYKDGYYFPVPWCSSCGPWVPINPPIQAHTELKISGLDTNYSTLNVSSQDLTQKALVANLLSTDGKTKQKQALINYKEINGNLKIDTYFLENNIMKLEYSKEIPSSLYNQSYTEPHNGPFDQYYESLDYISDIKEMDINSDGISELVLVKETNVTRHNIPDPNCPDNKNSELRPNPCTITEHDPPYYTYYVINPHPGNTDSIYDLQMAMQENLFFKGRFTDVDGDGLQELSIVRNGTLAVYKTVKRPDGKYKLQPNTSFTTSSLEGDKEGIIFSDLNGDGKTDLLVPYTVQIGTTGGFFPQPIYDYRWNTYLSNGKGFEAKQSSQQFGEYLPKRLDIGSKHTNKYEFYFVKDINRDGLGDFIKVKSWNWLPGSNDKGDSSYGIEIYENRGLGSDGKISYVKTFDIQPQDNDDCANCSTWEEPYVPIVGDFRVDNQENFLLITHGPQLLKYTYYDTAERARLQSIEQGRLTTGIEYKILDDRINPDLYKGTNSMLYPYTEIERLSQTKVVSKLTQGNTIQEYRYRGLISHAHGRGMIGFRKMARTNFYSQGTPKIWTGIEIDPLLDGLPIKQWTTKYDAEAFTTNLNASNTNLISYKETGYLITNVGQREVKLPNYVKEKDNLVGTLKETTIDYYTDYYLPHTTSVNYDQGFAFSLSTLDYLHNPAGEGSSYYIGRPWKKLESVTAYQDTKTTKEEYHYDGVKMDYVLKYALDLTKYIKEAYTYDDWGNILSKTVSSSAGDFAPQTISSTYESLGRFVKTKTNALNVTVEYDYTNLGMLKYEKDPFGNTVTNTYDNWGKLTSSASSLAGATNYSYLKYNDGSSIQKVLSPDGNEKWTYYDKYGRNTKLKVKASEQGKYIVSDVLYDDAGRKIQETEPYFEGDTNIQINYSSYDEYSRPYSRLAFNGRGSTNIYNGKTVTVNETTGRFKKNTVDALGNVISSEDYGGTILFKYNASGQQISAQYGANIVKTEYDEWGRKSSFHDPNNGKYLYEYYSNGLPKKETSPKGYKEYFYKSNGLLDYVNEKSSDNTSTNKTYSFTYNAKGQITGKSGTSNGKNYATLYGYHQDGRLWGSTDYAEGREYRNWDTMYDAYGNVKSYKKEIVSNGVSTVVQIENFYRPWDGSLYQAKEKYTGKLLWESQASNAKGQVLTARLGASQVVNSYDAFGFLTNIKHSSTKGIFVNTDYSFNAAKNELNSRHDYVLGIDEQFHYDEDNLPLNRLTSWTDPITGNMHKNDYDEKGRIANNYQVGKMTYATSMSVYRPIETKLNISGQQYYDYSGNSKLLQTITYNENNDPIKIDGTQGDYAFEYGLGETRRVMYYDGNFAANTDANMIKYYSEDTSMEVVRNKVTGAEKHIIYIGGSPYESDIVYLKDFTESSGSYKFLHKDYLGSILAISNEAGDALEIRHYDAWGNFTHLKTGNNPVLVGQDAIANATLLIDRGYTSHEHLLDVALIHMNGRLYDPLLRRFLNADENISDPENTQSYNKYGYVTNNPLIGWDRNGEDPISIGTAIVIGLIIGGASYTLAVLVTTGSLRQWNVVDFAKSVIIGGISSAATFGIGEMFKAGNILGKLKGVGEFLTRAGLHGVSQGFFSLVSGNGSGFFQGFVSGALGSLASSGWEKMIGTANAQSTVGMIAFGALSGGIGAELSGGNFFKGFIQGGIVAGLNHALHKSFSTDMEVSDSEYEKLSDRQKDKYIQVPQEALVEKTTQVIVSTVTPSGTVKVENVYITTIWGKTKWVLQKSLITIVESSKQLDYHDDGTRVTSVYYNTYRYFNDWISRAGQNIINILYPSSTFEKIYQNKSLYKGGDLTRFFNYLK
ncbi:RHS repeat-associated core domain-containing protein [Chryseobacterium defluvii]|nr:RHS repeat-associated core domain-containing protein [Chryseobacterium defluvii]